MKKNYFNRLLALSISFLLCCSLIPNNVLASEETYKENAEVEGDIYVSSQGNDDATGTKEDPYASLAAAVNAANNSKENNLTIVLLDDIVSTSCARVVDKDIVLNGNGHTIQRGDSFATISDNSRSWYNPAMIEVTTPGAAGASIRLENIVLDDAGKHEGTVYAQASNGADNKEVVQDGILAAYGLENASADIILGNAAVLKNFGGMSAVRVTGGAQLTLEAGSLIIDDMISDRAKGATSSVGPAGAVWVQGTNVQMNAGAEIKDVVGRAFYIDGGTGTIGGNITNIKADGDMWQGITGVGIHARGNSDVVMAPTCKISNFSVDASQGSVVGVYASDLDMQDGAQITDIESSMAVYMDDIGNDYQHKALINGTVSKVNNNPIMRSWYGHIEIGTTGVVENCKADQLLYTNNGSKYTINGSILNNSGTVLYLANQSGGRVIAEMNEGAVISGTKGTAVRVNNGSLFTMNGGTITNNIIGVQVSGKTNFKGVEFVMNGGEISNNTTGISYAIAGESKVRLNGGQIIDNGTSYQIMATGGSANSENENIYVGENVLTDNPCIYLSAGTVMLDDSYQSVSFGTANTEAKNKIKELVEQAHPTWTVAGYSALWISPSADKYHFKWKCTSVDTSGLYVAYIPLEDDGTPVEGAALTLKEVDNTEYVDVTLDQLDASRAYAVMLVNNDIYTLSPSDITIYTGGSDYDDTKGLPSDYTIDGIGKIESISINGVETTYRTYMTEDQEQAIQDLKELFVVSYVDETGTELKDDTKAGEYVAHFELKDPATIVKINGNDVKIEDGRLLIRYTSDIIAAVSGESIIPVLSAGSELTQPLQDHAVAIEIEGSQYYINNDPDHEVNDEAAIAILDDDLLTNEDDGREEMLKQRINEFVEWEDMSSSKTNAYDFHYLDLVDENNGNAWVSSSKGTIVYLPYPEGTDQTTDFQLVHFQDLHREYGISGQENVENAIKNTRIELIDITKDEYGIRFEIPQSGFSPFALVWQVENHSPEINADDLTLTVGDSFDPLEGVTAFDAEDGVILLDESNVTYNDVDTSKPGSYTVTYTVSDKDGATASKTITVTVKQAPVEPEQPVEDDNESDGPSTGSVNNTYLWMLVLLGSVSVGAAVWFRKRKNNG